MNNKSFIAVAVIIVVLGLGLIVFLATSDPKPVVPVAATVTPVPANTDLPYKPESTRPSQQTKAPAPVKPAVAQQSSVPPPAMSPGEEKIDQILSNSNLTNEQTVQLLIGLLPTLGGDEQSEAAQHISNLLEDKDYAKVLPFVKNPSLSEEVLDVFVTDLMNREDEVKLPVLLEIAKIQNHPHHEEAQTDLQIFLDEDFGTDWAKWETAMRTYLKKQAEENAADGPPPPTVIQQ